MIRPLIALIFLLPSAACFHQTTLCSTDADCPDGQSCVEVESGGICVLDEVVDDAGPEDDAGLPPEDAGPPLDAGDDDGGPPPPVDAGPGTIDSFLLNGREYVGLADREHVHRSGRDLVITWSTSANACELTQAGASVSTDTSATFTLAAYAGTDAFVLTCDGQSETVTVALLGAPENLTTTPAVSPVNLVTTSLDFTLGWTTVPANHDGCTASEDAGAAGVALTNAADASVDVGITAAGSFDFTVSCVDDAAAADQPLSEQLAPVVVVRELAAPTLNGLAPGTQAVDFGAALDFAWSLDGVDSCALTSTTVNGSFAANVDQTQQETASESDLVSFQCTVDGVDVYASALEFDVDVSVRIDSFDASVAAINQVDFSWVAAPNDAACTLNATVDDPNNTQAATASVSHFDAGNTRAGRIVYTLTCTKLALEPATAQLSTYWRNLVGNADLGLLDASGDGPAVSLITGDFSLAVNGDLTADLSLPELREVRGSFTVSNQADSRFTLLDVFPADLSACTALGAAAFPCGTIGGNLTVSFNEFLCQTRVDGATSGFINRVVVTGGQSLANNGASAVDCPAE